MLDDLIRRRPQAYVRHVEGLWKDARLQRQLRVLSLLTTGRARLYVFPVSLAETVDRLKPMSRPLRDGSGKYSSCSLPSNSGRVDLIVTPDDAVEAVYLSHEMEHLALGRLGAGKIHGKKGTPGEAVEAFATWVDEAAVSVRSKEFDFDPSGSDRERVEGGLALAGARGERLGHIYELTWSGGAEVSESSHHPAVGGLVGSNLAAPSTRSTPGIRLFMQPRLLGELAGLTYLAAAALEEKDAAELIYRARCFQVGTDDQTITTLPDILGLVARWARERKPSSPRDIEEAVERFQAALRCDLAHTLHALAGSRPSHGPEGSRTQGTESIVPAPGAGT